MTSSPAKAAQASSPRAADSNGHDETPRFARNFPQNERLQQLLRAFIDGHYNIVRKKAEELVADTKDPMVARAARELRRRIEPDPLAGRFLLGAISLLLVLTAWAYHVGH